MKYQSEAHIDAPADKVWNLLTDVDAQNRWNSTMVKVSGEFKKGKKVSFLTKVSPDRAFAVDVSEFEPGRMVLKFGLPLGLFKGERVFTVKQTDEGKSHFFTEEIFSGPLLRLFKKSMPDLQPSFNTFATDLKQAAEA